MGLYAFVLAGSNYFTPIICGFIADGQGWQWVFYWPAIFLAILFVFLFFFLEESNYTRTTLGVAVESKGTPQEVSATKNEGQPQTTDVTSDTSEDAVNSPPPRTYMQRISLWQPRPGLSIPAAAFRSLTYLGWPVIFYAGFSYGSYLILFNILNATASIILSGEPYLFSASMVGVSYVSCFIGVIIGSIISGKLSDWLVIKLARRNNGMMEAEHRLWPFVLCLVLVPGSLILWGVGAAHGVHWFGLIFAMGTLAFTTTLGVTCSVNYLIDSYHDISGDALVAVILVRNTMSFAISYG